MSLLALFIIQNFKTALTVGSEFEDAPFWVLNDPFATNESFFGKVFNIISMYLLVLFIVQNLKKKNS